MGVLVQPPRQSVARMADPPATMAADPNDPTTTTKMVDTAPPQLSPLSGAYLLIVVGEPFSEEHKKLILQKIQQGLYTWNSGDTHVDIETELNVISDCAPPGEEARGGERLIQFATENLVTEVLIHPQVNTLQQCMKNMLASFTKHRHIIHAGYTFAGQGSWILQDGTFSFEDFATAFEEYDVQRVIRSYENSISINVHCCQEGEWKQDKIRQQPFAKLCQIEVNPNSEMKESNSVAEFISYLEPFLQPQSIQERLPPSDVVGNIRFSHPTLYVFPGGQGDSALFGINGFNMLIDGGFSRKACFWDFTRHLDRLDAILITRLSDENTQGISAVLERKSVSPVYPQIGHFFANILETRKDKEKEKQDEEERDKLLVNVIQEGNNMIENLRILNLKPQICFRDNICDPINLYHKVGHGKLDMYVLNPSKESREVKEFLSRWGDDMGHLGKFKSGINVDGKELWLPIANLVSICALLVWQPANPNDTITRLLFPGSTPQNKIFKGLEKLRKLECLKYPACSPSTLKENKTNSRSEKKKRMQKNEAKNIQPDNSIIERKEKLAKRRQEKIKKEKEERERQEKEKKEEKEKEEQEKVEKEKRDKERQEKLEKKKKADKEKKDKERQERKEKEAAARQDKEERLKKEAAAKKEKEEKIKKEPASKKEASEQKNTEKSVKKKTSAAITKTKTKEITTKIKKTEVTNDTVTSSRKIMPSKPLMKKSSTPPSSKLKKDENNKKVMETRKAAFAAKTQKSKADSEEKAKPKKIVGSKSRNIAGSKTAAKTSSTLPDEERKVDEKSVAEKVSEAIASGEIDDSRVVKDDEEDKESIVEKDQIEEMETCPVDDLEAGKDNEDDEDDVELQRIKDEDDDDEVEENHAPVPDIAEKMIDAAKDIKKEPEQKNVPGNLVLEKEKISYSHVKTPDEVDDLPEHEVVVPDSHVMDEINSEMCGDLEEKIALDESEKESDVCKKEIVNEKSEGSVEAVRDNEIVEVAVEQKCMQVDATTPLNENNIEDHLNKVNEPECVEEKQYITTDKDKETDEKDFDKDASTEKVTEKESLDKKDEKDTDEKDTDDIVQPKESENDVDNDSEEEDFMIKPGFLKVIIFKAADLVNKDMIGKSDPFLKIKFRDQELKSRKVRNSLEPEWNFSANLVISSSNENSDIVLEVYDDDFGKENFIGSYTFSLKQAINDTDKEAVWYDLVGCKTGKGSFSTFYSPDDDQEEDDNETEKCNEKEIDQINKKEDMSLDNTQEEPKSVDKELPEKEKKEEDKTDSTATTIKDKELSSKASDKDIKELEIEPEIKAAETNDETEQSESSSDDHSQSSDSSEQSKDDQKEVNDKEGIPTDKGSIESEKEKGSDDKDTAPDSFINEIYTSEGRL